MGKHVSLGWMLGRPSFVIFMLIFKYVGPKVLALVSTAVRACLVQSVILAPVLVFGKSRKAVVEARALAQELLGRMAN
jgi:hypothetical protein